MVQVYNPKVALYGSEKRVLMHEAADKALNPAFVLAGVIGLLMTFRSELWFATKAILLFAIIDSAVTILLGSFRFLYALSNPRRLLLLLRCRVEHIRLRRLSVVVRAQV